MKNAIPPKLTPKPSIPPWQSKIDSFDRAQRRRDSLYYKHVILFHHDLVSLIKNNRKVDLPQLNHLPSRE